MTASSPADAFGTAGLAALHQAIAARWLLAFDFDGTLAPLVADPARAMIPAEVHADLALLAGCRPVAVITGRARHDVLPRLPPEIAHVIGNHGGEAVDGDPTLLVTATAVATAWETALRTMLAGTGLRVEAKGPGLAVHWRGHPVASEAAATAMTCVRRLEPQPLLIAGDQVLNLLPPGMPDKGSALQHLMRRTGVAGAIFIGDDVTDAAVFRLGDPAIIGIEVGDKRLGASWRVPDTAGVADLIHRLVTFTAMPGESSCTNLA